MYHIGKIKNLVIRVHIHVANNIITKFYIILTVSKED
jgi:hypothetical protein